MAQDTQRFLIVFDKGGRVITMMEINKKKKKRWLHVWANECVWITLCVHVHACMCFCACVHTLWKSEKNHGLGPRKIRVQVLGLPLNQPYDFGKVPSLGLSFLIENSNTCFLPPRSVLRKALHEHGSAIEVGIAVSICTEVCVPIRFWLDNWFWSRWQERSSFLLVGSCVECKRFGNKTQLDYIVFVTKKQNEVKFIDTITLSDIICNIPTVQTVFHPVD